MSIVDTTIKLSRRIPRKLVGIIFIAAIIAFFVLYLKSVDFSKLTTIHFQWVYVVFATIFALAFRYWGVMIWRTILVDLGASGLPDFIIMSSVYAKAWMGRYIPGTVTWIAGKVYMASSHGISKSRLAVSSLLEGGMQIIALMSVSLLILGLDPRLDTISNTTKISMILLGIVMLLTLSPPVFNRIVSVVLRLMKKEPNHELHINIKAVTRAFLLYAVGGFILGLAEFFVAKSVAPSITWHDFLFVVGAFNLAGAIGMLALFVPSGIGVRDGVLLVLLSVILPKELALLVTISSRLWSAVVDVIFYGIAVGMELPGRPQKIRND